MNNTLAPLGTETIPVAETSPSSHPRRRRIVEVVVSSSNGEVLYAWQCEDVQERLKLLECLRSKAKHFSKNLVLGEVDRWVLDGPGGRIIARFQPDWNVWVRVAQTTDPESS
jgi:hypothetical protein